MLTWTRRTHMARILQRQLSVTSSETVAVTLTLTLTVALAIAVSPLSPTYLSLSSPDHIFRSFIPLKLDKK